MLRKIGWLFGLTTTFCAVFTGVSCSDEDADFAVNPAVFDLFANYEGDVQADIAKYGAVAVCNTERCQCKGSGTVCASKFYTVTCNQDNVENSSKCSTPCVFGDTCSTSVNIQCAGAECSCTGSGYVCLDSRLYSCKADVIIDSVVCANGCTDDNKSCVE